MSEQDESKQCAWVEITFLYGLFFVVLLVVIRKSFLFESLWLDECLSYWIIKDDFYEAIQRATEYQGQSPFYYLILWGSSKFWGTSEFALRLPSLVCFGLSIVTMYSLGSYIGGRKFSVLALLFLITQDGVLRTLSARPYGLALFLSLCSVYALLLWIRDKKIYYWLLWILFSVLMIYAHYLFMVALIAQVFFLYIDRKIIKKSDLLFFGLGLLITFLLLIPCSYQLKSLFLRAPTLAFASVPTLKSLFRTLLPLPFLLSVLIPITVSWLLYGFGEGKKYFEWINLISSNRIKILIMWYLFPPLLFFAYSCIGPGSLFLDRYFVWYTAPFSLLGAWLISSISLHRARLVALSIVGVLMLVREGGRTWEIEDWKGMLSQAEKEYLRTKEPVLFYPGLVETGNLHFGEGEKDEDYLKAPLAYYRISFSPILIPMHLEDDLISQYREKLLSIFSETKSFIFISYKRAQKPKPSSLNSLHAYFLENGFGVEALSSKGLVELVRYKKE